MIRLKTFNATFDKEPVFKTSPCPPRPQSPDSLQNGLSLTGKFKMHKRKWFKLIKRNKRKWFKLAKSFEIKKYVQSFEVGCDLATGGSFKSIMIRTDDGFKSIPSHIYRIPIDLSNFKIFGRIK